MWVEGLFPTKVNGEKILVPGIRWQKCPSSDCGDGLLSLETSQKISHGAREIYRQRHHLLSAPQIAGVRKQYRMRLSVMARVLRVDEETVRRWEDGRRVPTPSQDALLRVVQDLPGAYELLRRKRAA